jgi:selenocysteine-specific elongation factor
MIVATAGHVDHGKTALVGALTGVDTDRLPEEKARGLTIDLGFAYVPLPDGGLLGFVDVPGHQRFIKNMLAGVGNIDHALMVVAADDGVMPQTLEHARILDLLGVARVTVAITKVDKVVPGRAEAVEADIRGLLGDARIDAVIRTSVRTGEGIAALSGVMVAAAARHVAAQPAGRFRMAVDRAFILHGVGVVVTGSVHAGTARIGEAVTVAPTGHGARLRGLRIHDRAVDAVRAGDRCAAQLSGISLEEVTRGDWIVCGPNQAAIRLDVELRLLPGERPLRHWTPAHLHIGAADLTCRIALISAATARPGEAAMAALHLDRPVAAWAGQKFILRDQSAQRTLGGGRVLDPLPPARANRATRLERLEAQNAPDAAGAFTGMLAVARRGFDLDRFVASWNVTEQEAHAFVAAHGAEIFEDRDSRHALGADHWRTLCHEIVEALGRHHASQPNRLGLNDDGLAAAIRPVVAKALLRRAVAALRDAGMVAKRGTIVHLAGHAVQPTAAELELWRRVEPALEGLRPPRVRELAEITGVALGPIEAFLGRAEELGLLHQVAPNRFYPPQALAALADMAERLAAESPDGLFAAADFKRVSGIGRNLTIQVLEYFDRIGTTQRRGDKRRMAGRDPSTVGTAAGGST